MLMSEEENSEGEVYDEEGREDMVDSDEMSPGEEGFMAGYEEETTKKRKAKEDEEDEEL